jgi:hypothetical protein
VHIYTHIVLAHALEPRLRPPDLPAYYLGAIIPDVRYLAGARRQHTHLTAVQLLDYKQRYPHLESFILGYLVHIEIDLIDLSRVLFQHTLLKRLNSSRKLQLAGVLIESHYLEHARVEPPLAEDSNAMLADLGIHPDHVRQYARGARQFLKNPSFQAELVALQDAQVLENQRMRVYLRLAQVFEGSRLLRKVLFRNIPTAEVAAKLPSVLLASPILKGYLR